MEPASVEKLSLPDSRPISPVGRAWLCPPAEIFYFRARANAGKAAKAL